ncbi:hypothetical protein RBWH47_05549 [Rhodopirellula baltica WH47]|uniref:Uncharacterized protein n=1 Tax=Rhodopirellula baltica WH47 TaxID=991778 RepID=F2AP86_RHOBT|nr:hypothetical protein RBWH47_05549 [Rhodopirellula baltica WH47]
MPFGIGFYDASRSGSLAILPENARLHVGFSRSHPKPGLKSAGHREDWTASCFPKVSPEQEFGRPGQLTTFASELP